MKYTVEQLLELGRRLEADPIPITRDLLHIRDRHGYESALVANPAQLAFEQNRGRRNIVLKARQMGMTTWIAGRFFLKTITARGVLTVQVAHTREAAESIFRMVQRFYDCLPEDMRKGPLKRSRANVRQMVFPELDSEFRVLSAADENSGRGLTVQNMHLSELSRWPGNAAETLAGLRAALTPSGELIMESTPNGASGAFYEEWQQADAKGTVKHFFPWWLEPAYVSNPVTDFTEEESELVHAHHLTPEQIGYRRTLESGYRALRAQEFAESADTCFLASGQCCFDVDTLQRQLKDCGEPTQVRLSGALRIWFPPMPDTEYIVAVDPAGGGPDGDFAAIQVLDVRTGVQCAEFQQRIAPRELAKQAAALGREYASGTHPALLAVERNNHGHAVIAHLGGESRYPNLYEQKGAVGWLTSAATRPEMIGLLADTLVTKPHLFRSRTLLEECRTFVTRTTGGSGAASGAHDDLVMAIALAHAVRAELKEGTTKKIRY